MSKQPKNLPKKDDRVKLRGREFVGTLIRIDPDKWSFVKWDSKGPIICHLHELEVMQ